MFGRWIPLTAQLTYALHKRTTVPVPKLELAQRDNSHTVPVPSLERTSRFEREGGVSRFVALIDQGFGFGSLIRRVSNTRPLPGLPPVNNKCRTALPTPLSNSTEQSPLPRRWMLGVSGVWWFATTASTIRLAEASAYMDRCLL